VNAPLHDSDREPSAIVDLDGRRVTLLGTAHVSRSSARAVATLVESGNYDAVAVELCESRYKTIVDPAALARMDLFEVIRQGRVPMVTASLALGAFQQRLADQFGIEPGADMRAAVERCRQLGLPLLLIDREIGVTLKRTFRRVSWFRRWYLFSGLIASVLTREKISEDDIERLKSGDILESAFAEFADTAQDIYEPIVEERDRYMAARLRAALEDGGHRQVLAVVGAGHLNGIRQHLEAPVAAPVEVIAALDHVPPAKRWLKLLPWLVVLLILGGFALGFSRSEALGWILVRDWILVSGGLCALGTALAGAHPLTVLSGFVAAPITLLNPTIGAGMVTAAVEALLRKPTVGDFHRLRADVTQLAGWRRNRVARVLLIFVLSTLGSATGGWVAGARIAERLISG
jgi:pheromone shutdown-related protein TraB